MAKDAEDKGDYNAAYRYALQAYQTGQPAGLNAMGNCFYSGLGVTKNYAKAVELYTKAAEQNLYPAQYDLANCYYNGQGVSKDKAKAKFWYEKAAAQGDEDAKKALKEKF